MRDLLAAIDALRERIQEVPQADDRRLQDLKTEILGRKGGALTKILAAVPKLAPAERKAAGAAANALKREFEEVFAARERSLKAAAGVARDLDLTMPGRAQWRGGVPPLPPGGGGDFGDFPPLRVSPAPRPGGGRGHTLKPLTHKNPIPPFSFEKK